MRQTPLRRRQLSMNVTKPASTWPGSKPRPDNKSKRWCFGICGRLDSNLAKSGLTHGLFHNCAHTKSSTMNTVLYFAYGRDTKPAHRGVQLSHFCTVGIRKGGALTAFSNGATFALSLNVGRARVTRFTAHFVERKFRGRPRKPAPQPLLRISTSAGTSDARTLTACLAKLTSDPTRSRRPHRKLTAVRGANGRTRSRRPYTEPMTAHGADGRTRNQWLYMEPMTIHRAEDHA